MNINILRVRSTIKLGLIILFFWLFYMLFIGCLFFFYPNVVTFDESNSSETKAGTFIAAKDLQNAINRDNVISLPFEMEHKLVLVEFLIRNTSWLGKDIASSLKQFRAEVLLGRGDSEEAAIQINEVLTLQGMNGDMVNDENLYLKKLLALAHLRAGEQENCLYNHNSKSCIFPLDPSAFHLNSDHVVKASEIYSQILAFNPHDRSARWLYNVCFSAMGLYPDSVPKEHLLSVPGLFEKTDQTVAFEDMAGVLGIADGGVAGGVVIDDFNNDGYFDVVVSSFGIADQLKYYQNDGNGRFMDRTRKAGLLGLTGGLNMVQADYNNDGFMDLLVLRGAWFGSSGCYPNSLLKNLGDGTFEDVTKESGLYSEYPTQVACWADFNLDGWIDVFIGNETSDEDAYNRGSTTSCYPSEFYVNNGDGTFTNMAKEYGLEIRGFVKGAVWTDIDNDLLPDLLVSIKGRENALFHNLGATENGSWSFRNVSSSAGIGLPVQSFGAASFDIDNDGWKDIIIFDYDDINSSPETAFVSEMLGEEPAVTIAAYRNNGNGTYTNATKSMGLDKQVFTMGLNYGDYDNDGYLDLYLGTGAPDYGSIVPNRLLRNNDGEGFEDVTFKLGLGSLQKGHGISFADIDNDGDQDIYLVQGGALQGDRFPNACYMNSGTEHSWISLKLIGKHSNRSAVGALIRLDLTDSKSEKHTVFRTVGSGGSFGANPMELHVGLGNATSIDSITVFWPNKKRTVQSFSKVNVNQFLLIREHSDNLEIVQKTITLPSINVVDGDSCVLLPAQIRSRRETWW